MKSTFVAIEDHPDLDPGIIRVRLDRPLAEVPTPPPVLDWLRPDADAPLKTDSAIASAIRDLLRHGGYRPTGRGKPASEYLVRAAAEGALDSINLLVDINNAVSLHSGLPISVVDLALSPRPHGIRIAGQGASYVFNRSGQEIQLSGLLCLFDGQGPCANAVKDSERTKTGPPTRDALFVLWGTKRLPGRTGDALAWMRTLLEQCGVATLEEP